MKGNNCIKNKISIKKLIYNLKDEHKLLIDILKSINDTPDSHEKLIKLKTARKIFIDHLKKEDKELYPELSKLAKKYPSCATNVSIFIEEIEKITRIAEIFFKTYSTDNPDMVGFETNFRKFFITIGDRILKEETILYSQAENLN